MELITKAPKGTVDIVPGESEKWQVVEDVFKSEAALNGFQEIRTPVFEHTELFLRGVGDTTDVVEKQMYTFEDKGGRSVTLRPEGTAGAVRAMLENGLYNAGYPVKLYYLTSCYRYEKAQKGRLREFHQFGVEMFGSASPAADAEVISMGAALFERLGVQNISLQINSIGCPTCRARYTEALRGYFAQYEDRLCETCRSRLARNPMRILDCKEEACAKIAAEAPRMLEYLCEGCQAHFEGVKRRLDAVGIAYEVNPSIVRGLDYYTRTVFEFISNDLGAQSTVCGGGRYDGLVEELGGQPMPALGFGLGLERLLLIMEAQQIELPGQEPCEIYVASLGDAASVAAFKLVNELHRCGVPAACDLNDRTLKAQMKYANKIGSQFSLVLGDDELASGKAMLKNMKNGEKKPVRLDEHFIDDYITIVTEAEDIAF